MCSFCRDDGGDAVVRLYLDGKKPAARNMFVKMVRALRLRLLLPVLIDCDIATLEMKIRLRLRKLSSCLKLEVKQAQDFLE